LGNVQYQQPYGALVQYQNPYIPYGSQGLVNQPYTILFGQYIQPGYDQIEFGNFSGTVRVTLQQQVQPLQQPRQPLLPQGKPLLQKVIFAQQQGYIIPQQGHLQQLQGQSFQQLQQVAQ